MRYHIQDYGYTSIFFLHDDLTFHDIQELGSVLYRSVQETNGALVVDMRGVRNMDITITGQFVAAHREAKSLRREFVLSNVCPEVLNTLVAGQVTNLVQVYNSTEEAIADIEERSRGGIPRKFVPDIKCGHSDCVYYTYARYRGAITQACQYPFPDEIKNDPTCRCFRMNWNQRKNDAEQIDSPFITARKKVLYEIRDQVSQELALQEFGKPEEMLPTPPPPSAPVHPSSPRKRSPIPVDPPLPESRQGVQRIPETTRQTPTPPVTTASPPVESDPALVDPFAEDNFPSISIHHEEIVPTPLPIHRASAGTPPVTQELKKLTPAETVRQYLDSWNTGKFAMEYRTLSKKSRGLSMEEYCQRRRSLQASQLQSLGKITQQEIGKVETVSIEGDLAHVEITRLDRSPNGTRCYAQFFTLHQEEGEWRISSSREGEERRNPVTPPKARVMKADFFQGKEQTLKKKTE